MVDKNGIELTDGDFFVDEKGKKAQIQNIRGVKIAKYKKHGVLASKVDSSKIEKVEK